MEAVVASQAELPSCSYYDEDIGRWDSSGLVVESVTELSTGAIGAVDVLVSCVSFHLSDFTVATTEAEAVFQPVPLVRIIEYLVRNCSLYTLLEFQPAGTPSLRYFGVYSRLFGRDYTDLQTKLSLSTPLAPSISNPVQTAGFDIVRDREISVLGVILIAVAILLFAAVWGISRVVDHRSKMAKKLETKVVDWYIATGEVMTK